jgi:hypothetical protein
MSAPVRRLGKVELLTKPGRPSPARLAVCTLLAAAVGAVGLTVLFLIAMVSDGASLLESPVSQWDCCSSTRPPRCGPAGG